jgi:hypothetical protein
MIRDGPTPKGTVPRTASARLPRDACRALWPAVTVAGVGLLDRSDKALRTAAARAFIDVMDEARLLRFGAGKAHLRVAFHAQRLLVERGWRRRFHLRYAML